ncbi:hypothetical protein Curi_c11930 [Gottschalkia acidurici 9a]|uniref:Phage protein n=1 Tax=Gottschalkia acidurici (strain ATCC 7906 / DSM 604 / BCRC 14475 / CIP 104303 / KCTC 5404 / NCIMB 10678 / 9a) TaxID=1128398 RepID=K0B0N3_GOTA9|nr:hypothetical protein [Gottschalkia acidurici]AFS78206.1 hypothetical protein Curi_c11930 [Gottschalkia acidurici 9a]
MDISLEERELFVNKVREGVKDLIDLNKLDDLDDFDGGLYITNVFSKVFKDTFGESQPDDSAQKSIKTFLWSSVYSNLEIEKYERYILESIKEK